MDVHEQEVIRKSLSALEQLALAANNFSVSCVAFNDGLWEKICLDCAAKQIEELKLLLALPEKKPLSEKELEAYLPVSHLTHKPQVWFTKADVVAAIKAYKHSTEYGNKI